MRLSIIVPARNEAVVIGATLAALRPLRRAGHEVIVVDGKSSDATVGLARADADLVITTEAGRARQMNAGAQVAKGEILLFLHADSRLPEGADRALLAGLARQRRRWGRFDVRLSNPHPMLRVVANLMNWRSRLTGIATGDQGIFVEAALLREIGGVPPIALMEDIALSKLLKRRSRPVCLDERVVTSSRRWERRGIFSTIVLMWRLRFAYWRGADPIELARRYEAPG
jgi:rSAM/selenodomain-associated transferase 2